jgi:sugar-specific transcriptional regulator TrmB
MKEIQHEDVEALTSLGLTVLQAKVYLALVKSGTATINEISKTAGVARQDLYRITSALQKLGLVERVIAIPTEFRAIELTGGISILLQHVHQKEAESHKKILKLMQRYKDKNVKVKRQESGPLFILVPEREAVTLRTIQELENAQTSMDSIIPWRKFSYLMLNARKFRLKKALKRGVKLRFITQKPEDEKQLPKIVETFRKNYSFKVRYLLASPSTHIGLFDKREVFVNTSTTGGLTEMPLLWSNCPSLVLALQDYFEIMWITAMESNVELLKKGKKVTRGTETSRDTSATLF